MKLILTLRRTFLALTSLAWLGTPHPAARAAEGEAGFAAKIWPLEAVPPLSGPGVFAQLRKQTPPAAATRLALDTLVVPARDRRSYARVTGALVAPESADYKFSFTTKDPAELWLENAATGAWELVQQNQTSKREVVKMQKGVPRRFQLWTWGRGQVAVAWRAEKMVVNRQKTGGHHVLQLMVDETIPLSRSFSGETKTGHSHADGLRGAWKGQVGLNASSDEGPDSRWGDPDGDGLLNWQEQIAGSDPRTADAGGQAGLVTWELWRNLPGSYVFDLTRSVRFPDQPDEVRYLPGMEMTARYGDNYGTRMRALVKAPSSGDYTFLIMADDHAELWLSTTESPTERKLIAKVEQARANFGWARFDWERPLELVKKALLREQISAKVKLQQGQSYYVEVLHKQDRDQDSCAVAWMVPGAKTPQVVGGNVLTALPRETVPPALAEKVEQTAVKRLTCDLWDKLPGSRASDLYRSPLYPAQPTQTTLIDNMDFKSEGDSYGCRLRGFLTAPADGPYTFHISGNDACLLFLGESANRFTKRLIVETRRDTGWRSYERNFSQHSDEIVLKKGRKYYIEVLFKRGEPKKPEAANEDHASVAWTRPGRQRTIIDSAYFSPYQRDARDQDDDGLPDVWEAAHGLDPKDPTGKNGAWGDPDGDLLENLREYQAGLDPQKSDVQDAPRLVLWQRWAKIKGGIAGLRASPAFSSHPTEQKWIGKLEGSSGWGKLYGSRLRAYLVPPTSGDYTFAIAGRAQGELWLSPSEEKADRRKIAGLSRWTGFREWHKDAGQVSRVIHLEAGQRYYLEALHHQGGVGRDHVSVAWKVPGAQEFAVIRGSALAAYAGDPQDVDEDDLPDDWEKAHGLRIGANDGAQDADGDGLSNRQEYLLRTDPRKADTDGDGANDFDEVLTHGDPHFQNAGSYVGTLAGEAYGASFGAWEKKDGQAWQTGRRGSVTYPINVPRSGVHALKFTISSRADGAVNEDYDFRISLNGQAISYQTIAINENGRAFLAVLSPWLNAGETYECELFVDNSYNYRRVSVDRVEILAASGADANKNGIPEWVETLLRSNNGFDAHSLHSRTSPATVEGRARYFGFLNTAGVAATKAPNGRFFAEVPLTPDAPVNLEWAFENGGLTQTARVQWEPTNLQQLGTDTLTVRQGDSLLLTAVQNSAQAAKESYTLGVQGQTVRHTGDQPTPVAFPTAGTQTIQLTHTAADGHASTRRLTVHVLPLVALESPLCITGFPRLWTHGPLPPGAEIQFDENVSVLREPTANTYSLATTVPQDQPFVVRQGAEGPILGSGGVKSVCVRTNEMTGNILERGGNPCTVRLPVVVSGDLNGAEIRCRIKIGGVTFVDGATTNSLWVKDFDEFGTASLLFLKEAAAHSNCRAFSVWKDGVCLAQ